LILNNQKDSRIWPKILSEGIMMSRTLHYQQKQPASGVGILIWQACRFVVLNLKMMRIIVGGHS